MIDITSLDPVEIGEWWFKVSLYVDAGSICVVSINIKLGWVNVRFFEDEDRAKDWVEYLSMQKSSEKGA